MACEWIQIKQHTFGQRPKFCNEQTPQVFVCGLPRREKYQYMTLCECWVLCLNAVHVFGCVKHVHSIHSFATINNLFQHLLLCKIFTTIAMRTTSTQLYQLRATSALASYKIAKKLPEMRFMRPRGRATCACKHGAINRYNRQQHRSHEYLHQL